MAVVSREEFYEISPADFFYRNRDIAGFSNPARALYSAVRELVENSLDAGELARRPPDIYVRLSCDGEKGEEGSSVYTLRVEDNGSGVPARHIPQAFGQVFYGSKYRLRQARGTFGLGGTMAILYGQITNNRPVHVISSADGKRIHEYTLMIDIKNNRPIVLKHKVYSNHNGWRGTIIETKLEGEYSRAMPKILEYFRQTAVVAPYANLTFVDPKGRLYRFERATEAMPKPPVETKPHPYGIDVETMKRMIAVTQCRDMVSFLREHFHKIGRTIALRFLLEEAKKRDHRKIGRELDLFSFHPEAPASPFFHPRGAKVYNLLVDFVRERYEKYGIDLEAASGESHHVLPAPSTFIIASDGVIRFQYTNPDYAVRLHPSVLLAAARAYDDEINDRLRRQHLDPLEPSGQDRG